MNRKEFLKLYAGIVGGLSIPGVLGDSASAAENGSVKGIALDEANRMGLALPGLALAKQLYLALQAQGHGRDGTHALQLALSGLSGVDWKGR